MKKHKIIIGAVLLVAALSLGWVGFARAYNFQAGVNVSLGQDQKVDSTVFAAGNTVDIASEVFGDVFCAGQTVTVSGIVHGDVICAGQTVVVSGHVFGDVRLAGQTVNLSAKVDGNASAAGQSFNLTSDGKVAGDLSLGAATANLNGPVGRDLVAGGNNIVLTSQVGRNVAGYVRSLQLSSTAHVKGNVDFTSDFDAAKATGAKVDGKITRHDVPRQARTDSRLQFAWGIYWLISMLFTALVLAIFFPSVLHRVSDQAVSKPWKALLVGLFATVSAPAVMLLLALTVVGLPLVIILGLLWAVAVLISWVFFAYYLGRLILKDSRRPIWIALTGTLVLCIAYVIPLVGFLAFLLALCFGTGTILLEAMHRLPKPVYTLPEAPKETKAKK